GRVLRRVALAAAVAFPLGAIPGHAAEGIKVLVNDQPITSFDIAQRAHLMALTGEKGGTKAAMESLINEIIELAEAKRLGMVVPDSRVDAAYASIAHNMKLDPGGLDKALKSQGLVPETLKRRLRAQIAWSQLVQAKARFEVSVKSSEINAALASEKPDKLQATEYLLQQVIFVVPKGSSAGYANQRKRDAEAFRARYTGCDGALTVAKNFKDVTVRPVSRRTSDELVGTAGETLLKTPVGKAAPPHPIDVGFEVIGVCAMKKINGSAAARADVENKLMDEKGKDFDKKYLQELRAKAVIQYR